MTTTFANVERRRRPEDLVLRSDHSLPVSSKGERSRARRGDSTTAKISRLLTEKTQKEERSALDTHRRKLTTEKASPRQYCKHPAAAKKKTNPSPTTGRSSKKQPMTTPSPRLRSKDGRNSGINADASLRFMATDLQDPIKDILEKTILGATKTVLLVTFSLSSRKIIQALKSTAERGVQVSIIYDATQKYSASPLLGKKPTLYPIEADGDGEYKMHHKMLVVDHTVVVIGSGNFVDAAFGNQGNFFVQLSCKKIANRVERVAKALMEKDFPTPKAPLEVVLHDTKLTMFSNSEQGERAENYLVDRITSATTRIFIAMFTFTPGKCARAICDAKKRGVDVRVVLDKQLMEKTNTKVCHTFVQNNITCGWRDKGLLHYKVALIDNILITGSRNWTSAAFNSNDETTLAIDPIPPQLLHQVTTWWNSVEARSTIRKTKKE